MNNLIVAVLAYLLGSVSFAVLVSGAMGLADPRSYGSGNPGATNVLRSGNKAAAVLTLVGDAFKGWLAVWLARHVGVAHFGLGEPAVALAALAAFLGHLYPVFFRFKGGKGVATAAGVLLALDPLIGGAVVLVWLAVAFVSRYSSLAALTAAACAPLFALWRGGPHAAALAVFAMGVLLFWRHRANIAKLASGTESRIGDKKKDAAQASPDTSN